MKTIIKNTLTTTLATAAAMLTLIAPSHAKVDSLIVAGGCFWCVESDFEKVDGVISAVSGYIGGHTKNPDYDSVSSKKTGHYEAVKITFDDTKVSLKDLTDYFWRTIDPTDPHGQFCDKGSPYYTAMFYQNEAQRVLFTQTLNELNKTKPFSAPIATKLLPAKTFYNAEGYHQDYYKKNPVRYKYYRWNCGRDQKIKALWGKVASEEKKH